MAVLCRARDVFDPSVAVSCRDGTKLLEASFRALSMDCYATLGVRRQATEEEVRRAYLEKARRFHPDKNGGSTSDLFAAITAAYNQVSSLAERRLLERRASEPAVVQSKPPRRTATWSDDGDYDADWEHMFWSMTRFKLTQGHCYAAMTTEIGSWAAEQRLANENGKLAASRRKRLEAIGFNVDDVDWRKRILEVKPPRKAAPAKRVRRRIKKKLRDCSAPVDKPAVSRRPKDYLSEQGDVRNHDDTEDAGVDADVFSVGCYSSSSYDSSSRSSSTWSLFGNQNVEQTENEESSSVEATSFRIAIFGFDLMRIDSIKAAPSTSSPQMRRASRR